MGAPSDPNAKIGFSTYAMWALCFVVVGVCYALEQNTAPSIKATLPADVDRVLDSGAYLMSEREAHTQHTPAARLPAALCLRRFDSLHTHIVPPAEDGSIQQRPRAGAPR